MIKTSQSVSDGSPMATYRGRPIPMNPVVERLAAALSSAFTLPDAQSLATMLQVPVGQDVDIVLQQWIFRCLLEIDEAQAALLLPRLVARLDEILASRSGK